MEDAHEAEEVIEVPDEAEEAAAAVPAAASAAQPSMELNAPSGLQVEPVFATQVISKLFTGRCKAGRSRTHFVTQSVTQHMRNEPFRGF